MLLEKLTDDLEIWRELTDKYEFDIFCGLFANTWNEGFNLSPKILARVADRNLTLAFDLYAPTSSWPDDLEEKIR